MTREEQLKLRDEAFREDRERFFKVADSMDKQPKFSKRLSNLEAIKQLWRDVPQQKGYPNIDHPPQMASWFPKVNFASSFKKDEFDEDIDGLIVQNLDLDTEK